MKKRSIDYLHFLLHKKKKIERHRRRRKNKVYNPVFKKNTTQKSESSIIFEDIVAPSNFTLKFNDCEKTIEFINKIKETGFNHKNVNVLMADTQEIGEGAISMLLSVFEEIGTLGCNIKGSKPKLQAPRDILEKSGFFKYMNGIVDDKNRQSKNIILKTGKVDSDQELLSKEIRKAMETVWGTEGRNPLLYGTVVEMMRNTVDHAYKNKEQTKWHFAISHDEAANKVKFAFVDNGKGIINSFKERMYQAILTIFKDNVDLIETAFMNGIESRTGLKWRGKGLPTILENFKDNCFKDLVIITNDVYIDFQNGIKERISVPFQGAYYYFVVDQSCIKACFT